jgi:hypothetical protein
MFLIIDYDDSTRFTQSVTNDDLKSVNVKYFGSIKILINVDNMKRYYPDTGKWTDVEMV